MHREVLSTSVSLMSSSSKRGHKMKSRERCARKAAWDYVRKFIKLKNADKTKFFCPVEVKAIPAPTPKLAEERDNLWLILELQCTCSAEGLELR